jgi:hypothetical protein
MVTHLMEEVNSSSSSGDLLIIGGGQGWCRNVTIKDVYFDYINHPIKVETE